MKTILIAATLTLAPAVAYAMGCSGSHDTTAASCPEGQTWDADKGACIVTGTS